MAVGDVFSSVFIKVEIKSLERFGGCHGNCALYGAFVWIQTQPLVTEKYKSAQKRNLNCYSHSINKFWFIVQYMSLPMMKFRDVWYCNCKATIWLLNLCMYNHIKFLPEVCIVKDSFYQIKWCVLYLYLLHVMAMVLQIAEFINNLIILNASIYSTYISQQEVSCNTPFSRVCVFYDNFN